MSRRVVIVMPAPGQLGVGPPWLSGGTPYSRHRTRVADALGVEERELWPDAAPPLPDKTRLELVGSFAHANDVLAPDWRTLLKDARQRIDLLDLTLLEVVSQPGVSDLLAHKAAGGCQIRLLISSVDSLFVGVTEHELNPDYSPSENPELAYDIRLARGHIEPLLETAGIEARKYLAMRFNTIVRCDDQMLVTLHLHGTPAREAPLLHLRQADHPGLFAQFEQHYQAIWENASDPVTPEPDLFPNPITNPDHYRARGTLFDDTDDTDDEDD